MKVRRGLPRFSWRPVALAMRRFKGFPQPVVFGGVGPWQRVIYAALLAKLIKGMVAGRPPGRLVLLVDRETVGELGAVVGQDGVNFVREVGQEAFEEAGGRRSISFGMDL